MRSNSVFTDSWEWTGQAPEDAVCLHNTTLQAYACRGAR